MKIRHLTLAIVFGLLGFGELVAQQRRSVLLNTNPEPLKFTFQSNFPFPVTLANKGLRLQQWLYSNTLEEIGFQVVDIQQNKTNIGQSTIRKGDTSVVVTNLNQKKWDPISKPLDLNVVLSSDNKAITFYGSNPSLNPYSINKQPKLVIDYEVSKEPYGTAWSQLDGNAQHNNRIDWAREGNFVRLESRTVLKGKNIQYISSYQNKIIVFGKEGNSPYMAMLNGDREAWRVRLEELPAKQPVISPEGKMFFVSNANLVAVDLNEAKLLKSTPFSQIVIDTKKNTREVLSRLTNEITLGYDGTLYMPLANGNGNFGIIALSAYPSLKPRWFYNSTNAVGPVSLSENERMAFFIETDKETTKSRVVVLDNVSGEVLTQSESILGAYANDGNSYIPPVVIQTAKNDTTVVYALDGNKTANKLYVFKVHHNQLLDKPNATLQPYRLITSSSGMSQPTVKDNSTVLFIDGKSVGAYSHQNNIKDYAKAKPKILQDADFIETDSKIVGNKSAKDYYIISKRKMFLVNIYPFSGVSAEFDGFTANINKDIKSVIILPNYSVYLLYLDGDVDRFFPFNFNDSWIHTIHEIKNKTVVVNNGTGLIEKSATILPAMVVSENIQAIVSSYNTRIQTGFKVQKGAALTFQSGI